MKMIIFSFLFLFVSCAGYVNSIHKEIDGHKKKKKDNFSLYRKKKGSAIDDKITLTKGPDDEGDFEPRIKRQYKPVAKARVSAQDLQDNESAGSLWSSETADGYLFSRDAHKNNGDIIVVKVQGKLKNEITSELKRAFPAPKKKTVKKDKDKDDKEKDKDGKDGEKTEVAKNDDANNKDEEHVSDETKVYDQISSVVIEEVNKEYVLLRGQKEVIFRGNKRFIELQALIPRKDILEDDTVLSSHVLESNILVVR